MKTHDSQGRKLRDQKQYDPDVKVDITERDLDWFNFIHRHGGLLPTSFIHDWTASKYQSLYWSQVRLKLLARAGYLRRPDEQFETKKPEKNELIHELTPEALELIEASEFAPSPYGSFKHQVMVSCISASLELNARKYGAVFTPQHEILEKVAHDVSIRLDEDAVVTPDLVCALTIEGKTILCLVEVDRGTQRRKSGNISVKSWTRSIKQYRKIIGQGLYKEHYGVTCGAFLFVVTISQAKQDGILEVIADEFEGKCTYILVTNIPEFGKVFHPPRVLDLLTMPWLRQGHTAVVFAEKERG